MRTHLEPLDDPRGPLFHNANGRPMTSTNYSSVWRQARAAVWGVNPQLATATLYDLRHAAATMMLHAGVPPAEVARRLGHSVDVLTRIYSGVMSGEEARSNELIDTELGQTMRD